MTDKQEQSLLSQVEIDPDVTAADLGVNAEPESVSNMLDLALSVMNGCVHDGGFDREIGPIGCYLGDKCICIGVYPLIAKALSLTDKQEQDTAGVRVRHKMRGSEYEVIGIGKMQAENWRELVGEQYLVEGEEVGTAVDMREVVIYRSTKDPSEIWVRPREEFNDGRFETISTAS